MDKHELTPGVTPAGIAGGLLRRHRKVLTRAVVLGACISLLAACGSSATPSSSKPTTAAAIPGLVKPGYLTLATAGNYPPFSYFNSSGKLTGYSISIGEILAQKLGLKLATPTVDYAAELAGVESGRFDMGDSGIWPNAANRSKFLFTIPDASTGFVATVLAKNASKYPNGLNDLKGLRVGAVAGSTREQWALANKATLGYASYTGYPGISQALLALENGSMQLFIDDPLVAAYNEKVHPGLITTTGPIIQSHPLAIAIRQSDTVLQKKVNAIMKKMVQDGTIAKLQKKYWGKLIPTPSFDTQQPPYSLPPTK